MYTSWHTRFAWNLPNPFELDLPTKSKFNKIRLRLSWKCEHPKVQGLVTHVPCCDSWFNCKKSLLRQLLVILGISKKNTKWCLEITLDYPKKQFKATNVKITSTCPKRFCKVTKTTLNCPKEQTKFILNKVSNLSQVLILKPHGPICKMN
jgi:hypothetical protein